MANAFASADIALLVATFPPPSPTGDIESLVGNKDGTGFHQSSHVVQRFRKLLDSCPCRVKLADLPSRLDVDRIDWLLALDKDQLHYGRDGHTLLTRSAVSHIVQGALSQVEDGLLPVDTFAFQAGVSFSTLESLLSAHAGTAELRRWRPPGGDSTRYLYDETFATRIQDWVRALKPSEYHEGVDACRSFANVPAAFLLAQAKQVDNEVPSSLGNWELLGDRAIFVPAPRWGHVVSGAKTSDATEVEGFLDELDHRGFVRVPSEAGHGCDPEVFMQSLYQQLVRRRPNDRRSCELARREIKPDGRPSFSLIAKKSVLMDGVEQVDKAIVEAAAGSLAVRQDNEDIRKLTASCSRTLQAKAQRDPLLQLLVQDPKIKETTHDEIDGLLQRQAEEYRQVISERLLAPLELYTAGLTRVHDDTLKQHLEQYLGEYFRTEVLPSVVSSLQERRLLLDRTIKRDLDRVKQAYGGSSTFSEMQIVILQVAARQKIAKPPQAELQRMKTQTLQQKLKVLRKTSRASDVLQNLIWILLACRADGLYTSSGKDTSRMLKLLQAVAGDDGGVVARLTDWRDALRAGGDDTAMLDEMRKIAAEAVEGRVLTDIRDV